MSTPWIFVVLALWAVVMTLGFLVLGTLRRLLPVIADAEAVVSDARRATRRGGLTVGTMLPAFSVETVNGGVLTRSELRGEASVVLFLGVNCPACEQLNHDLARGHLPDLDASLVVVSNDPSQAHEFAANTLVPVVADVDRSITAAFESDRTPHAFVLDDELRVVGVGSPNDWVGLRELIREGRRGGVAGEKATAA